MKVEFVTEVPQEILQQKRGGGNGTNPKYDLRKLFSGEEKVVLFSFDSRIELRNAQSSVRQTIRNRGKKGEFSLVANNATNQLYVYKI